MRVWLLTLLVLMLAAVGCEKSDPTLELTAEEKANPTAIVAAPTSTTSEPQSPEDYRRLAEGGDVDAMLLLGRSHESLGQRTLAKQWYGKAAAAGSEAGKKALENLDAPPKPPVPTRPVNTVPQVASAPSDDPIVTTTSRRSQKPPPPSADPSKLRWIDITSMFDAADFVVATKPNVQGKFIGVMTAPDNTITVAASGTGELDLNEVTTVVRVKNKQDPTSTPRIGQAGALTARITNDNVNQREFVEWVTQYLRTEQRSEPIFRNGWRIMISGSVAEGVQDKKEHLGAAVMIEMKK